MKLKSQLDYSKVFENKSASVFDNMDRLIRIINEAEGDEENADEAIPDETNGDENNTEMPSDAPTEGGDDMGGEDMPPDAEGEPEGDPADEDEGVYVSPNEYASLAKTILDALQATPPKAGEIPNDYLTVTEQNANNVIKFVQAWLQLDLNGTLKDNGKKDSMTHELKHI